MTQRNESVDTRADIEQEPKSPCGWLEQRCDIDAAPMKFGNGVPEHRGLGDRRMICSTPEVGVVQRRVLIVNMRDEPRGVLGAEEMLQFTERSTGFTELCPSNGVEAGVPEPLERIHVGVGDRVALGTPVGLQHRAGRGPEVGVVRR
ncbi:unannotated protein [freshwater metagenome]|uniref:Unannotated protein n=1 Tax=freshwater metagenome TaxID=449393 RepID=A0A6J7K6H0_9ZZZZ